MVAPSIPVSEMIDIGVDAIHPEPVDIFPAATVMRTLAQHGEALQGIYEHLQGVHIDEDVSALRFKVEIVESENASLLGRIKTLEAINTITRSQERRTRSRMEQQLALVEETLRGMLGALRAQQRQGVRAPEPHDAPEDADSHT
ncbi:hypothetical protein Tco_1532635 [Tanacetum coccineum]